MPVSSMVSAITAAPNRRARLSALVGGVLAVLEIDRVDDRLAAIELERGFEHRVFGRVDDQRRVDRAAHAAHHLGHVGDLVAADKGGAEVERVRALLDLLAPHLDAAVPIALPPAARRKSREPLALQRSPIDRYAFSWRSGTGRRARRRDGVHGRRARLRQRARSRSAADAAQHRVERGDVRGLGAAAAADRC